MGGGMTGEEVPWHNFASDEYLEHYYADPHADDEQLAVETARAFAAFAPQGGLRTLDVGTGPNLYPLLAVLPYAGKVTAWEYASSNVAWLRQAVSARRLEKPWPHYWQLIQQADLRAAQIADPAGELARRLEVVQGSIFDLPVQRFDAATMFFCAESITRDEDEFRLACRAFAGCVRPGGLLVAAFLAGSKGYEVAGVEYPAVAVDADVIEGAFRDATAHCEIRAVGCHGAEIRSGYSGALLLTARAASELAHS